MGRCLRCAEEQRQQGRKEEEIVWETYQGESSRSVPTRAGEHFGDYQAAMRKPAPVRRGGNEEEEGSSSWRFHHGGPPYVLHILKAMHLSLKMKFLGAILVHPVRRQNFAGKLIT